MKNNLKKTILYLYKRILIFFLFLLSLFYKTDNLILKLYQFKKINKFLKNNDKINKLLLYNNITKLQLSNNIFEKKNMITLSNQKNKLRNINKDKKLNIFYETEIILLDDNIYYYQKHNVFSLKEVNYKNYSKYFYEDLHQNKIKVNESRNLKIDIPKNIDIIESNIVGLENKIKDWILKYRPIIVNLSLQTYKVIDNTTTYVDFIGFMKKENYLLIGMNNEQNLNTLNPFINFTFLIDVRKNKNINQEFLNKLKIILKIYGFNEFIKIFFDQINKKEKNV